MNYKYISIPKTASQSIHRVLGNRFKNHQAINKYPIDSRFSFTFIREPLDRLISWYSWHRVTTNFYQYSFKEWVDRGCSVHWGQGTRNECGVKNPLNQWEFIVINNKIAVDFIGDFSYLRRDFKKVCDRLGIKGDLPVIGESQRKHITPNRDTKRKVEELFKRDFEIYGTKKQH